MSLSYCVCCCSCPRPRGQGGNFVTRMFRVRFSFSQVFSFTSIYMLSKLITFFYSSIYFPLSNNAVSVLCQIRLQFDSRSKWSERSIPLRFIANVLTIKNFLLSRKNKLQLQTQKLQAKSTEKLYVFLTTIICPLPLPNLSVTWGLSWRIL